VANIGQWPEEQTEGVIQVAGGVKGVDKCDRIEGLEKCVKLKEWVPRRGGAG